MAMRKHLENVAGLYWRTASPEQGVAAARTGQGKVDDQDEDENHGLAAVARS